MSLPGVQIVRGLSSPHQVREVAALHYQAFSAKLEHLDLFVSSREQAVRILERSLAPEMAFFALREGCVLGAIGLEELGGKRYVDFSSETLQEEFGGLGGLWRQAWLGLAHAYTRPRGSELRVDTLAVREDCRGQGIGSLLLERLFSYAQASAFSAVTLEVVDTNPRARVLYERLGFVVRKEERYGAITARAGVGGVAYMVKEL